MRYLLIFLLLLLSGLRPAAARETAKDMAAKVAQAYEAGDMKTLRAYARNAQHDPWLVTDRMCRTGACRAALVYARAMKRQDAARLPAYLEKRRSTAHDEAVRSAIDASKAAGTDEQRIAALKLLEPQRDRGDVLERVLVASARAQLLAALKRPAESAEAFGTTAQKAERIGWLGMAAFAYKYAGLQARQANDLEGMLRAWTSLLTVEQGRGDKLGIGRALVYVGNVHSELGDYDRALPFLRQADTEFEDMGDLARRAWAHDSLGEILQRLGRYSEAQRVLQRGLEFAQEAKVDRRIAHLLTGLGGLRARFLDLEGALASHREALAIFVRLNDQRGIAQCRGNIGVALGQRGDLEPALKHVRHALRMYQELGSTREVAVALTSEATILIEHDRFSEAESSLTQALALARTLRDEYLEVHVLLTQGTLLLQLKELDRAAAALALGMRISAQLSSARLLMDSHRRQAELFHAKKKHGRSVHSAKRALEYMLTLLTGLAPGTAAGARDALRDLFKVHIEAAVAWGRPEAVFDALEGARAGALLESLENRAAIENEYVPERLDQRRADANRALQTAARAYQQAVRSGNRTQKRKTMVILSQKRDSLQAVIGDIQREARAAASVLFPVPVSLADAQDALLDEEALVLYSLLGRQAVALVVTPTDARIVKLGTARALADVAETDLTDHQRDVSSDITRLHDTLVKPLKLKPTVRRVLLSPDGILGYVPFSLLLGTRDVVYVPSASALGVLRSSEPVRGKGVLAIGDPNYRVWSAGGTKPAILKNPQDASLDVPAAEGEDPKAGDKPKKVAKDAPPLERGGMRLIPLPATRKEVTAIGHRSEDLVLLGRKATLGRFLMAVKTRERWRAIHLACHGVLDTERPMRSGLALALDREGRSLLTCLDVFQHRLPADLAVLSACNTGRGKVLQVEGIVGLTQAFMLAGSPRVLVSLWKVDDEATYELMLKFYELWNPRAKEGAPGTTKANKGKPQPMQPGLGAAEALRLAQEHVRKQKKWSHPYYWGAWVLWGRPD